MSALTFTTLVKYSDYEIAEDTESITRFVVRNKNTKELCQTLINSDGYAIVQFNDYTFEFLNILISDQNFATNKKKSPTARRVYEFVSEIPDKCVEIGEFNGYPISDRYKFDPDNKTLYLYMPRNKQKYKVIHPTVNGSVMNISLICDDDKKNHTFSYRSFLSHMSRVL